MFATPVDDADEDAAFVIGKEKFSHFNVLVTVNTKSLPLSPGKFNSSPGAAWCRLLEVEDGMFIVIFILIVYEHVLSADTGSMTIKFGGRKNDTGVPCPLE